MSYIEDFNSAVKLTNSLNLGDYECLKNTESSFFNDEERNKYLPKFLKNKGWDIRDLKLEGECLTIHYNMKKYIDEFFNVDSVLTIGYVECPKNGKKYYERIEVRRGYLNNNVDSSVGHKIHAWLTLPSAEILDFTYFSTEAAVDNTFKPYGSVIVEHGDEQNWHRYVPQLVGVEYLIKAGFVKSMN